MITLPTTSAQPRFSSPEKATSGNKMGMKAVVKVVQPTKIVQPATRRLSRSAASPDARSIRCMSDTPWGSPEKAAEEEEEVKEAVEEEEYIVLVLVLRTCGEELGPKSVRLV